MSETKFRPQEKNSSPSPENKPKHSPVLKETVDAVKKFNAEKKATAKAKKEAEIKAGAEIKRLIEKSKEGIEKDEIGTTKEEREEIKKETEIKELIKESRKENQEDKYSHPMENKMVNAEKEENENILDTTTSPEESVTLDDTTTKQWFEAGENLNPQPQQKKVNKIKTPLFARMANGVSKGLRGIFGEPKNLGQEDAQFEEKQTKIEEDINKIVPKKNLEKMLNQEKEYSHPMENKMVNAEKKETTADEIKTPLFARMANGVSKGLRGIFGEPKSLGQEDAQFEEKQTKIEEDINKILPKK